MGITDKVKDILSLDSFVDAYVKAGLEGLDNIVHNVFFMEVPDIYKYVDPYGMLLTTLYPIANDEEAIQNFIPNLVEKKVSCLALKLGRYIYDVPPIMLEQADKYQFPLIILPNNANLSKLSNDILELFLGEKTSKLEYREKIHSKLMGLLLEGADLHKLVSTVSELFGIRMLFVDRHLQLQSASFKLAEETILIKRHNEKDWRTPFSELEISIEVNGCEYSRDQVVHQAVAAGNEYLGFLIALLEENTNSADLIIGLEQASMLCAFLFQRELALQQNERNYLDSFIRDILNCKFSRQQEAVDKAKLFDWDLSFPLVVVAIEVLDTQNTNQRELYSDMLSRGPVEQLITQGLEISSRNCKLIYHDEVLLCLISVSYNNSTQKRLKRIGAQITAHYKERSELGFGISKAVSSYEELMEAQQEAKFALEITKKLKGLDSFIAFYDETGIYKMLHHFQNPIVLNEYVEEKLGPLLTSGGKESELLDTLLCMLKNGFNLQKAAKEMYIHYNTLRYRIDKLKEYGIDTSDGLELAEVALAYQMHKYLQTVAKI